MSWAFETFPLVFQFNANDNPSTKKKSQISEVILQGNNPHGPNIWITSFPDEFYPKYTVIFFRCSCEEAKFSAVPEILSGVTARRNGKTLNSIRVRTNSKQKANNWCNISVFI